MVAAVCHILSLNTRKSINFFSIDSNLKRNLYVFYSFCRDHIEWNQISNNVKPGGNFVVLDLEPATWYNVRITAHNSAGFTVAEYEFATLTVTGGIFFLFKMKKFMKNAPKIDDKINF